MTDSLDFHRWIDPAGRGASQNAQTLTTTDAERAEIARWLDVPAVHALTAEIAIRRSGSSEAEAEGRLKARVELVCGVSLEPFTETFDVPVQAVFRRPSTHVAHESGGEAAIDIEADEPRDWTQHGIDLGAWLAEELSLALPDFPRKPGAEMPEQAQDEDDDAPPNPFAVLKGLTEKP